MTASSLLLLSLLATNSPVPPPPVGSAAPPAATPTSRRVAIIVSSDLASGQAALRYAGRDASRMGAVLRELGAFAQIIDLRNPTPAELRLAFDQAEFVAARQPGVELLFYYSGHADPLGLLLGDARFTYQELRDRIERSRAAVRVALLDACHSGEVIRTKGGRAASGYSLEALAPSDLRGAAIVAASTARELAQESSLIEGSYFTHHLLSALRGAADLDANGAVTLTEAYRYTYARTIAATLPSVWGTQHPSFEYRLAGTGDLVLTRVSRGGGAIVFPVGADATTYFVQSAGGEEVVAEVTPPGKSRVRIALPPGRYRLVAQQGGRAFAADVRVPAGGDLTIDRGALREIRPELAQAKGGAPAGRNEIFLDLAIAGLGPGVFATGSEVGMGWRRRGLAWSWGVHAAYGHASNTLSSYNYTIDRARLTADLIRRLGMGAWEIQLGGGLGAALIHETLNERRDGAGAYQRSRGTATAPTAALFLALEVPLRPWLPLRFSWGGAFDLVPVDGSHRLVPELRAAIASGVRF